MLATSAVTLVASLTVSLAVEAILVAEDATVEAAEETASVTFSVGLENPRIEPIPAGNAEAMCSFCPINIFIRPLALRPPVFTCLPIIPMTTGARRFIRLEEELLRIPVTLVTTSNTEPNLLPPKRELVKRLPAFIRLLVELPPLNMLPIESMIPPW